MDDPLNIHNEMRALDRKQRDWFDQLEPEFQKKFSPFLMIRWGSTVQGSQELQEYYVFATNQRLNKHFFSINAKEHKKFLWLMATSVSPDMGTPRHSWIPAQPREKNSQDMRMIRTMYPHLREDEVALLACVNTTAEIKQAYRQHGIQD